MKKCKVCGEKTDVIFNIDFIKTPICEECATAIFLQQAKWYAEQQRKKLNIPDVSVAVAVEQILQPKYMNDVYTWNQVRNAIIKATER